MKKILLLLVLVSFFNSTYAQVPSNCAIPPLLANEYHRDITQLAAQRLFELQSPDTIMVKVPQAYIDTISNGLAAIFNATSILERDSVFNLYCVHNLNPFSGFGAYDGFLVKVDTNYAWTNAWQNLITITGDPLMDSIVTKYSLTITNFYNWSIGNYAVLSVDSSWNNYALIDSIEMVTGVLAAEQNSLIGVAGKISFSKIGNTLYYDFDYEYQDCFDGCDAYRRWKFKVNDDCSVEYLGFVDWCFWGVGQCPLPAPLNCNVFTSIVENNFKKEIVLYPNPAKDKLNLKWNSTNTISITIYNALGQELSTTFLSKQDDSIDISNLQNGLYFLKVSDGNKTWIKKLVVDEK